MRRSSISNADIVRAARAILMERGVDATITDIARRAGVGRGTLHLRFGSKEALIRAALTAEPPPWTKQLEAAIDVGDPRDNLFGLFEAMIAWFARVAPLAMLGWSDPRTASAVDLETMRGERELANYLDQEMLLGRLDCFDPEECARMIAAVAWDRAIVGGIEGPPRWLQPLWIGLAPRNDSGEPASSNGPRPVWPPTPTAGRGTISGAGDGVGDALPTDHGAAPQIVSAVAAEAVGHVDRPECAVELEETQRSAAICVPDAVRRSLLGGVSLLRRGRRRLRWMRRQRARRRLAGVGPIEGLGAARA